MGDLKLEVKKLEFRKAKQAICTNQNAGDCCGVSSECGCCISECC